jgi:DNA-binding IclR family transcriptional regulator
VSVTVRSRHPTPVRTVSRALDVLQALGERDSPRGLSLTEVSTRLRLPLSTAYRMLAQLEAEGFVQRHPASGGFILGAAIIRLGCVALNQAGLGDAARAVMQDLQGMVKEGVTMAVLRGGEAMYIHQVESSHVLRVDLKVGSCVPLHCSAVGKALLAFQPAERLEELIGRSRLARCTERTITAPDDLRAELARTRQRGYSVDDEEFLPRVRCIGAPIRNTLGEVVAAMAVTGPADRMNDRTLDRIRPLLLAAAARISSLLGNSLPPPEAAPAGEGDPRDGRPARRGQGAGAPAGEPTGGTATRGRPPGAGPAREDRPRAEPAGGRRAGRGG